MPIETITITVQGANPVTKTVQVSVDPTTGKGTASITLPGTNGGQDTVVGSATIAGSPFTSNSAFVGWQATNGPIALINDLVIEKHAGQGCHTNWDGTVTAPTGQLQVTDTLVFCQVNPNSPVSGYATNEHTGPVYMNETKSDGTALEPPLGKLLGWGATYDSGNFTNILTGTFVVAAPGILTFYWLVDDAYAIYMADNGVSRVAGTFVINGGNSDAPQTANGIATNLTPQAQAVVGAAIPSWPALGMRNNSGIANGYAYINFPVAGLYRFIAWWVQDCGNQQCYIQSYAVGQGAPPSGQNPAGAVIKPVARQAAPPPTTPAGNIQLSIGNGNQHIQSDPNGVVININVTGIVYKTKPYIPILEGTTGLLYLSGYNFPLSVDNPSAATAIFGLSADNTSWQGRLTIAYDAGASKFELQYNGNTFDPHVATSQLTLQDADVAWFDSANKNYDVFTPSLAGGGDFFGIEVDYMVKPTIASVSPASVTADGGSHTFTLGLSKPFPPQQFGANNTGNTLTPTVTMNGSCTVTSTTPVVDSSGWITGYTVQATVPSLISTNGSASIFVTLQGTLTYLSGDHFVTGNVVYINNVNVGTITLVANTVSPPVAYGFTITGGIIGSAGIFLVAGSIVLTGKVYSAQNNISSMIFYQEPVGSTARVALGTGTKVSAVTGVVNGQNVYITTFTLTISASATTFPVGYRSVGFVATDANSLTCTYWDSNKYYNTLPASGGGSSGGSGGTGCFTGNVGVQTPTGFELFGSLPHDMPFMIQNETGEHLAVLLVHENYTATMIDMGDGKLVTLEHLMKIGQDEWLMAQYKWRDLPRVEFTGTVYNLHINTDDPFSRHYILDNGEVAHNAKVL